MKSAKIPLSSLTPSFIVPEQFTEPANLSSLLLGQQRLVDAFHLSQHINKQHLFIADYQGINRPHLISALLNTSENQDYLYLSGIIRRKDLIGYKDPVSGLWQHGALAQAKSVFICAESLWKKENLWELLFDCLEQNAIKLSGEQSISLRAKVMLIGNASVYASIRYQEPRFHHHFPLLGEMNCEIDTNQYQLNEYCQWLKTIAQLVELQLDADAYSTLLTFSTKLTEHQQRLSLDMGEITQTLNQAAVLGHSNIITSSAITEAIKQKHHRHNTSEIYSAQSFDDAFINLPTQGEVIGQINGLTVIDAIDYTYGEPARITTSVHYGDGEVADIERKSELGGNIHAKGLMILTSCLYRIFGRDEPLHLNADIVFEQSYQEIDGDSASLAEYCCLISAIAEKPISQNLAITGALDQLGNVQAIGGVNEKIEGFYNLCERRGLTGCQGVIIPKANLLQLNLPQKIIDSVKEQKFHLYQISHMDEAVELLMQMPAGQADENNDFPADSLYGMVQQRLDRLAGNFDEEPGFWTKLRMKWSRRI